MEGRKTKVFLVVASLFILSFIPYDAILDYSIRTPIGVSRVVKDERRGYAEVPPLPVGWWTPWLESTSTIYQPLTAADPHSWCFPTKKSPQVPPKNSPVRGLLFIKNHKASSSTCAGVNMAIAHHVARRKFSLNGNTTDTVFCENYYRHYFHSQKKFAKHRITEGGASLLWTFVRNPMSRDLSEVYHFQVTRGNLDPEKDADRLLQGLQRVKGKQTRYLSLDHDDEWNIAGIENDEYETRRLWSTMLRQKILEQYDFIGVTERMAESLAVMTILWDLDPTDVIVLSAKQSSVSNGESYDDGRYQNTCFKMIPAPKNMSDLQPSMAQYLQSKEYIERNPDFLLYYAAHKALDRTIEAIGRDKVAERTETIMKLQSLAEERCQKEAIFPCSNEGIHQTELSEQNCYWNDAGCGYACVDQVMSEFRGRQGKLT